MHDFLDKIMDIVMVIGVICLAIMAIALTGIIVYGVVTGLIFGGVG